MWRTTWFVEYSNASEDAALATVRIAQQAERVVRVRCHDDRIEPIRVTVLRADGDAERVAKDGRHGAAGADGARPECVYDSLTYWCEPPG